MTYNNIQAPEATCWNIQKAFVTHKGNEYRFWAEHELLQDEVTYEFIGDEPDDNFDFEQFDKDVRAMLENYDQFCEDQKINPKDGEI